MTKHSNPKRKKSGFYVTVSAVLLAAAGITRLAVNSSVTKNDIKDTSSKSNTGIYVSETVSSTAKSAKAESKISSETVFGENSAQSDTKETKSTVQKSKTEKSAGASPIVYSLPIKGTVQKDFSRDNLIYSKTYGDMRAHNGIDIVAKVGDVVKASADGKVTKSETDTLMGKTVTIEHGGGIVTYYSGLKDVSVKVGDKVKMGKVIGTVGEIPSEILDNSHLHFAATENGKWISPLELTGN